MWYDTSGIFYLLDSYYFLTLSAEKL